MLNKGDSMKNKILLVLIGFIFLTGCNTSVNVEIDKNGGVEEKIIISENASNLQLSNQTYEQYINEMYSFYSSNFNLKNYEKVTNIGDVVSGVYTKRYSNICAYFNQASSVRFLSTNMKCEETKDAYNITGNFNYFNYEDADEIPEITELELNMHFSDMPISSNANKIESNTYTWDLNSNSENRFELQLKKSGLIKDELENNKKDRSWLVPLSIFGVIIILFIFIGLNLKRKYYKNKLDF